MLWKNTLTTVSGFPFHFRAQFIFLLIPLFFHPILFLLFPHGYPSAAVGTCWCWWPGGTENSLGISMVLLCKCHQHFLVSAPLLICSISTSPTGSWSHFHPNDFTPLTTPPRISPDVTQPRLFPLCMAQEEAAICSCRQRSDQPQHIFGA